MLRLYLSTSFSQLLSLFRLLFILLQEEADINSPVLPLPFARPIRLAAICSRSLTMHGLHLNLPHTHFVSLFLAYLPSG